ncbi:hypothetical protein GCM10009551_077850 [Nocardiopsis tropica]
MEQIDVAIVRISTPSSGVLGTGRLRNERLPGASSWYPNISPVGVRCGVALGDSISDDMLALSFEPEAAENSVASTNVNTAE